MLEVNLKIELGSPAEKVWEIVGNFNGLPGWHPLVEDSIFETVPGGIGRRVTITGDVTGHRALTERLVSFDAVAREYAYTIISGPVPFVDYIGRFAVVPLSPGRCIFEFRSQFRAKPPYSDEEAAARIRNFYQAGGEKLVVLFGK